MREKKNVAIPLTLSRIEEFLKSLDDQGRSSATVRKYGADVKAFYYFLPEDKVLISTSVSDWRNSLVKAGFATRTINSRVAACNSLLGFLGRKAWQVSPFPLEALSDISPVSREEYHLLLETARRTKNELAYFLVRTFCCLGLAVAELPLLTIDSLVAGKVHIVSKNNVKNIFIPEVLKIEFLNYAKRQNINSGALFKSPEGQPLTRGLINQVLLDLCEEAGVPEVKGIPQNLRKLYTNTYSDIRATSSSLIDNAYAQILEQEHADIGWDSAAV